MKPVQHYEKADIKNIEANFSSNKTHRFSLTVPFLERDNNNTICIIGQNPSKADEYVADKTLHYLERYVFEKLPQYSNLIMLNLYTRIDTNKDKTTGLHDPAYTEYLKTVISNNSDFLIVFGEVKNEGAYKFTIKAQEIKEALKSKNVFKLNLQGAQYAPHPGNPKILYNNINLDITKYDFTDIN
jgi:hypothetical protein